MNRFMRENLGATQESMGVRRAPQAVRNLLAKLLTGSIILTWVGPQNLAGVLGYNVYVNSQKSPAQIVPAPQFPSAGSQGSNVVPTGYPTLQATVSNLASATPLSMWVSCFTSLLESPKTQIIVTPA